MNGATRLAKRSRNLYQTYTFQALQGPLSLDGVPPPLLKKTGYDILKELTHIFSKVWDQKEVLRRLAGFRAGRYLLSVNCGSIDEQRRPIVGEFLNITGAFDSVDRVALRLWLLRQGVPERYQSSNPTTAILLEEKPTTSFRLFLLSLVEFYKDDLFRYLRVTMTLKDQSRASHMVMRNSY